MLKQGVYCMGETAHLQAVSATLTGLALSPLAPALAPTFAPFFLQPTPDVPAFTRFRPCRRYRLDPSHPRPQARI